MVTDRSPALRRRTLLLGGAGALVAGATVGAVEVGLLPGRVRLDRALGRGRVDAAPPAGSADPPAYATFSSQAMRGPITWGLATPPGVSTRGLPVVLVLHGRGADAHAAFDLLVLHRYVAAHVSAGGAPLAVASVDGGVNTYWHPRADGTDPLAMITGELLPRLSDVGLRTDAIGVLGWSMGGYGALLMARESGAGRLGGLQVRAASAASPALFVDYGSSAQGSFDSAADWARWGDLIKHPQVSDVPLQVSCGTSDPFAASTRVYRSRAQPTPAGGLSAGRHDGGYWRSLVPDQLRFFAQHLTA